MLPNALADKFSQSYWPDSTNFLDKRWASIVAQGVSILQDMDGHKVLFKRVLLRDGSDEPLCKMAKSPVQIVIDAYPKKVNRIPTRYDNGVVCWVDGCVLCGSFAIFELSHRTTQVIVDRQGEYHHQRCKDYVELSAELEKCQKEYIEEGGGISSMNPILKAVTQIAYSQERSDYEDYESRKIKVLVDVQEAIETPSGDVWVRRGKAWSMRQ